MSIDNFIPEIWSARLLVALRKTLVYGGPMVVNRNWEGEISQAGDTVKITSIGRPTVVNYVPNSTVLTPETLTSAQRNLVVDQAKAWVFEVDDVDARQVANSTGVMSQAIDEAAYAVADVYDQYIAAMYTSVPSGNQLGTVGVAAANPENFYDDVLVPLYVKLTEASVPKVGRYVVIPPWATGRLLLDDRFVGAGAEGSGNARDNGVIGRAAGFTIMESNNCPNPTSDHNVVLAGTNAAITAAEAINKTEAFRPESAFADAVKGLNVYGAKVIMPTALASAVADPTP